MFKELVNRFTVTRETFNKMKSLSVEESQELQKVITEAYNANGELSVKKYIENTRYLDEMMVDLINPGNIETAILSQPYHLSIFIPDYPPRLKQYGKTKFSTNLGYGHVSGRWQNYMAVAINELWQKGAICFIEPVAIIYKFHFHKPGMDTDNYATKFINDTFRYAQIISEDSYEYASTHYKGVLDKVKNGIEITVISEKDYVNNIAALI